MHACAAMRAFVFCLSGFPNKPLGYVREYYKIYFPQIPYLHSIAMVELSIWDEINKALFRRHMPKVISAKEMLVFRKMERVFSGKDKQGEVHQCSCGDLFYLSKKIKGAVPKDWLGDPICPHCGKTPEAYKEKEWRQKFNKFVMITEALRRFEESDPSETLSALREIRALSKGLFKFRTTDEMYVGYHKLMTELGEEEKDFAPDLKPEYRALIDELFEKGKRGNIEEFIKFIFSPDPLQIRQIEDTIRESQRAIVRAEKDYFLSKISDYPIFVSPLTIETIEESRVRFSLLLYNHLIELDALYALTMNLIRVSKGEKISKTPIPKSLKYPREKISLIAQENSQVGKIFQEFWIRQVRNAFSHSKYKIERGLFIKTDEEFQITLAELQRKIDLLSGYWRYLHNKVGKEEVFALDKKVFHTKNGDTVTISGEEVPSDI